MCCSCRYKVKSNYNFDILQLNIMTKSELTEQKESLRVSGLLSNNPLINATHLVASAAFVYLMWSLLPQAYLKHWGAVALILLLAGFASRQSLIFSLPLQSVYLNRYPSASLFCRQVPTKRMGALFIVVCSTYFQGLAEPPSEQFFLVAFGYCV